MASINSLEPFQIEIWWQLFAAENPKHRERQMKKGKKIKPKCDNIFSLWWSRELNMPNLMVLFIVLCSTYSSRFFFSSRFLFLLFGWLFTHALFYCFLSLSLSPFGYIVCTVFIFCSFIFRELMDSHFLWWFNTIFFWSFFVCVCHHLLYAF